jgi:hypothetical protein
MTQFITKICPSDSFRGVLGYIIYSYLFQHVQGEFGLEEYIMPAKPGSCHEHFLKPPLNKSLKMIPRCLTFKTIIGRPKKLCEEVHF